MKLILLAVDSNNSVTAHIYHAQLAALKEILCLERVYCLKHNGFSDRHNTAEYQTVVHRVCEVYTVFLHNLVHHEMTAQLLCVIFFDIIGMTCTLNSIGGLCHCGKSYRRHSY